MLKLSASNPFAATTPVTGSPTTTSNPSRTAEEFAKLVSAAMRRSNLATNGRKTGESSSTTGATTPVEPGAPAAPTTPGVGQVVTSPFNPLGLPISGTPAPTAAEVAANPAKYAGTSFDPNVRMSYNYPMVWEYQRDQGLRT